MPHPTDSAQPKPRASILGKHGEVLVAHWLQQQGWTILARGWSSRWGELDIVAFRDSDRDRMVAFVEVKTRTSGNWDADGLLAITPAKQSKLWKTAQLFLAAHPHLAELPCRFDVALVGGKAVGQSLPTASNSERLPTIEIGQPIAEKGYCLTLKTYLESAFESG
jgi:putative endonuclease